MFDSLRFYRKKVAPPSAYGFDALTNNTSGDNNTGVGSYSLYSTSTGIENTAVGANAMLHNTTGGGNAAIGYDALDENTTGRANTAEGDETLLNNTTGIDNTANGAAAMIENGGGSYNTADGAAALYSNTGGTNNIAVGYEAGYYVTGNNNIDIGNAGTSSDAKITRIGTSQTNLFVAGVYGVTAASGVEVYVNSNGQLGTATSSKKYKDDIQTMGDSSDVLLSLHPVTFKYKHDLDPQGIPQYGLVAEDVEKIDPGLVAHDAKGQPYTVRYGAVNAMLLNEFLKEHRTVTDLQQKVDQLEKLVQTISSKN